MCWAQIFQKINFYYRSNIRAGQNFSGRAKNISNLLGEQNERENAIHDNDAAAQIENMTQLENMTLHDTN